MENKLADLVEGKTLVKPAYTDLKKDDIRDLAYQFSQVWPQERSCLMAGPIDEVDRPDLLDILLKGIEEPLRGAPELILWARDYGGVPLTIRSRCGEKYHYAPEMRSDLYTHGEALFRAVKKKDVLGVVSALKSSEKGDLALLLKAYLEVLLEEREMDYYDDGLRGMFMVKLTPARVYEYFMGVISWR